VEKETMKLLANTKGECPWKSALKQRSKDIRAAKVARSPHLTEAEKNAGVQKDSSAVETAAAEEPAETDGGGSEAGEDVPDGQEESLSSKSTTIAAASPKPSASPAVAATQPPAMPAQGLAHQFAEGDIVRVSARQRPQYDKCKAKILAVLTGDVKVEMLEGPSVGADRIKKFKFNQVTKVISTEPKSEQKKKEGPGEICKPRSSSGSTRGKISEGYECIP
jgi:hypothetical protein